jgi:hypothetical protein
MPMTMNNCKRWAPLLVSAWLVLDGAAAAARPQLLDQIVAVVGARPLWLSQLVHRLRTTKLREAALQELIDEELVAQEAARLQLTTTEGEIDRAVQAVAKSNNVSVDKIYEEAEQRGFLRAEYRALLGRSLLRVRLCNVRNIGRAAAAPDKALATCLAGLRAAAYLEVRVGSGAGRRNAEGEKLAAEPAATTSRQALACAAPSTPRHLQWEWPAQLPREKPQRVAAVSFRGNKRLSRPRVQAEIRTARGGSSADLRADLDRLWALGELEDVRATATAGAGGLSVTLQLVERPALAQTFVEGLSVLSREEAVQLAGLPTSGPVDPVKLREKRQALVDEYVSRGHARAAVRLTLRRTPAGADLCLHVDEGPAFKVGNVRLTGLKTLKAQDVQGALQTRAGGLYKPEVLERDLLAINALCYEHGLITCRVSDPKRDFDDRKSRVTITIAVQEGPVFRLGKVGFTGKLASPSAYRWLFQTRPGDVFIRSNLLADISRIQDWHREKGQGEVMVTPQSTIHTDQRTVDILFEVEPPSQP